MINIIRYKAVDSSQIPTDNLQNEKFSIFYAQIVQKIDLENIKTNQNEFDEQISQIDQNISKIQNNISKINKNDKQNLIYFDEELNMAEINLDNDSILKKLIQYRYKKNLDLEVNKENFKNLTTQNDLVDTFTQKGVNMGVFGLNVNSKEIESNPLLKKLMLFQVFKYEEIFEILKITKNKTKRNDLKKLINKIEKDEIVDLYYCKITKNNEQTQKQENLLVEIFEAAHCKEKLQYMYNYVKNL